MGNTERLAAGTALCSRHGRYLFGMDGSKLFWRDCVGGDERVYFDGGDADGYFFMGGDASFIVSDGDGTVKWKRGCKFDVRPHVGCLGNPSYDCPYLHLHSGGTLVLNWIDGEGEWKSRNVDRLYPFDV